VVIPAIRIIPLAPAHAATAARLHIAGQPDAFLPTLGPDVLTVVYRALPQTRSGFGYGAAVEDSEENALLGFVSATTGVGGLFAEIGARHGSRLLPPLLAQSLRRPRLLWRSVETLFYPLLVARGDKHGHEPAAELLSIMVEPQARSRGIGARLVQTLAEECRQRGLAHIDVTVDAANEGAQRFYARHGFVLVHSFRLYGREMRSYRRGL
jgi:ribosomal protein S18 acetylase RimI-like enzyme